MDVVHVHHPFLSGRLALNYCRRAEIPIVFTNHTRYDLYAQARLPLMPTKSARPASGLYARFLRRSGSGHFAIPWHGKNPATILACSHIEVVPNGVDLRHFHAGKAALARWISVLPNRIFCLSMRDALAPEKNLEFLMQSFAGVSQIIPNVHLLIVGGGQKQFEDESSLLPSQTGNRGPGAVCRDDPIRRSSLLSGDVRRICHRLRHGSPSALRDRRHGNGTSRPGHRLTRSGRFHRGR